MSRLLTVLDAGLARAKARERRLFLTGAGAAVVAVAAVLGPLGRWLGTQWAVWGLRIAIVSVAAATAALLWRRWPASLFASRHVPDVIGLQSEGQRSSVQSAAEFLVWKQAANAPAPPRHTPPSLTLVKAHVEQTEGALSADNARRRVDAHFSAPQSRANVAAAAAGVLLVTSWLLMPSEQRALWRGMLSASDAEISDLPLVGDLSLSLKLPAYTGLPPREVRGGDGTIRALKGTTVVLRATADRNVRAAELHIGEVTGAGDAKTQRVVPLGVENGRELVGELTVERSERYRFVLKPLFGSELKERKGHPIIAEEDKLPVVDIREPAQDLELKDTGRVVISYFADDDFAVTELSMSYRINSGEMTHVQLPFPSAKTKVRGDYAFDLSPLQLEPGDVITLELEAKDNDTVSGPKRAVSRQRRITVYSAEQQRLKLFGDLRRFIDQLVDQLADELENPSVGPAVDAGRYVPKALSIDERGLALAGELTEIARGLKEAEGDKPRFAVPAERSAKELSASYTAKRAVDAGLSRAQQSGTANVSLGQAAQRQIDTVALLERTVVYFEDLRALATIEEMKASAKELSQLHQEMRQLLEKYRDTGDENLKRALETEMDRLKQKIAEIGQKMAELRKGLPQEFVNREAFQRMAMENIFEKMDRLLAENKLDELAQEMDRLQSQLGEMERRMDEAQNEYGGERYSELRKELQEFAKNLDSVQAAQKDMLDATKQAEQRYREAVQRRLGQNLEDLVKKSVADLNEAQKQLQDVQPLDERVDLSREKLQRRIEDIKAALEHRDFLEARDSTRQGMSDASELNQFVGMHERLEQVSQSSPSKATQKAAHGSRSAQSKIGDVQKRLDKLFPDPREVLSPKEMQQLAELRRRQQEIGQRAQKLGQQMRQINKQAPIFDPQAQQEMDGAGQAMDRAGQELGQGEPGRAISSEASALSALERMKDQMKRQSQGGQGSGMPMPVGGVPNPFGDGFDQNNRDKVEIPSEDAFKVPAEFRRDILDAMKQGMPARFKQQIDEYYKELIK